MKNFIFSPNSLISWILKIFMLASAVYFLIVGNLPFGLFSFMALFVSLLPAIVNRSYDTNLPWTLDFFLTLWLACSVVGEIGFYQKFWWWDVLLHFGGTAVLVYLAFVLVFALNFTKKIRLSIPLIGFATFLVGVAFGAIWEIAEFYAWRLTGNDALAMGIPPDFRAGLFDTFSDLQLDAAGSFLIALIGMKYVARQRHVKLREWMRPFIEIFDEKVRNAKKRTRQNISKQKKKLQKRFSKKSSQK
ncbi:MAG: hypothetical protein K9L85_02840 [Candidatus Peribacteraceae bacterium]|nr:hypothetical protein [Candidatus Peribacteraceae bacterium]